MWATAHQKAGNRPQSYGHELTSMQWAWLFRKWDSIEGRFSEMPVPQAFPQCTTTILAMDVEKPARNRKN